MARYAEGTEVSVERSKAEIETLVTKYGANSFASAWQGNRAAISFDMKGKRLRFELSLPEERQFRTSSAGRSRTAAQTQSAHKAEIRRLWRALLLVIKSKLESVESEIETFEEAFLANIVLPGNGQRFGAWAVPELEKSYRTNEMPPLLPAPSGK
jgi:hypothetical protein